MKKRVIQSDQFSVITYDYDGRFFYSLYINGHFYNTYTSMGELTAALQALVMGVLEV